jgi:RNA recognition motif-containing protein
LDINFSAITTIIAKENMDRKIYVGNLPITFEEFDLEKLFKTHGKVISVGIFSYPALAWSGKYGYVEMSSTDEASNAVSLLNNYSVDGKRITVSYLASR